MLRDAVFDATRAEITEVGLRRLSMEGIASRAGTGKAALYRRWPNVRALVIDALANSIDELDQPNLVSTGALREDLLGIYGRLAVALNSESGRVMVELLSEATRDRAIMSELKARYGERRDRETIQAIEQAMLRGEVPRQNLDPYVLQIAPALIFNELLATGVATTGERVEHIVDTIVLPLLRHPSALLLGA